MTTARYKLVDREIGGFYHITTTCAQHAALTGRDPLTGINLEHRKAWIERRILEMSQIFPVHVFSYAVMSNHYHIVVQYQPYLALDWGNEELVARWLRLYAPNSKTKRDIIKRQLLGDSARLQSIRAHLGNLSWFMASINQYISRRANHESDRSGHFWAGRFHSRELRTSRAIIACMAYNDLNPIRAGVTTRLDQPSRTSLYRRLQIARSEPGAFTSTLCALTVQPSSGRIVTEPLVTLEMTLGDYYRHVLWAKEKGKRPQSTLKAPQCVKQPDDWIEEMHAQRQRRRRAAGIAPWYLVRDGA